jgi:hypothetical protein
MKRLILRYEGGSEVKLLESHYLCPKLVEAAVELSIGEDVVWVVPLLLRMGYVHMSDCELRIEG